MWQNIGFEEVHSPFYNRIAKDLIKINRKYKKVFSVLKHKKVTPVNFCKHHLNLNLAEILAGFLKVHIFILGHCNILLFEFLRLIGHLTSRVRCGQQSQVTSPSGDAPIQGCSFEIRRPVSFT
ncbi:hypothetical protein MRX96_015298 [Rhipicephalus microplus]